MLWMLLYGCIDSKETYVLPSSVEEQRAKEKSSSSLPVNENNPVTDIPPAPNITDGCRISHMWEESNPKEGKGIQLTGTLNASRPADIVIVDLINRDGEIVFGFLCPSKTIDIAIPKNLGQIYAAVFIDANNNGPSKDDLQGLSKKITIAETEITLPEIELSTDPISMFNFDGKE